MLNNIIPFMTEGKCFLDYDQHFSDYKIDSCLSSSKNKPKILIFGDSFAANLYSGLNKINKFSIIQYTATSCRPLTSKHKRCSPIYKHFFDHIVPSIDPDIIIIAGYWYPYFNRLGPKKFFKRLKPTIKMASKPVLLIGQTPIFHKPVPRLLALKNSLDLENEIYLEAKNISRVNLAIKRFATKHRINFVDLTQENCKDGFKCIAYDSKNPLYRDFGHVTEAGSDLYAEIIAKKINEILEK